MSIIYKIIEKIKSIFKKDVVIKKIDSSIRTLKIYQQYNISSVDLDIGALLLDKKGKAKSISNAIFYQNVKEAGVELYEDDNILINLDDVPEDVKSIVIASFIYDASDRNQTFANVSNMKMSMLNNDTNETIYEIHLNNPKYRFDTLITFGKIVRENTGWKLVCSCKGSRRTFEDMFDLAYKPRLKGAIL